MGLRPIKCCFDFRCSVDLLSFSDSKIPHVTPSIPGAAAPDPWVSSWITVPYCLLLKKILVFIIAIILAIIT